MHTLDWWESLRVEIDLPPTSGGGAATARFDVTCTPAQHISARGVLDRFKALWASWVVQEVPPPTAAAAAARPGASVYFAGDTGYRLVRAGQDEALAPTCPAFKEIGDRWGAIDFAMIPIGCVCRVPRCSFVLIFSTSTGRCSAYMPRELWSPMHCAPNDSVDIFQDVRAKRALGMHWGCVFFTMAKLLWSGS